MTLTIAAGDATSRDAAEFIDGANASFGGGWGDQALFRWAFLEPRAGRVGRLIQCREDDRLLAASGVTFRHVSRDDARFTAAIMTGSWTHPEARGRGLFPKIVEQSADIARADGADALLAFVTATNATARRLREAGATMYPSFYCRGQVGRADDDGATRAATWSPVAPPHDGATRFAYDDGEWITQFMHSPHGAASVRAIDGAVAVVTRARGFDRIETLRADDSESRMGLVAALQNEAATRGSRLFSFSTDPAYAATLRSAGFEIIPGFVSLIPTGSQSAGELAAHWELENGDRL